MALELGMLFPFVDGLVNNGAFLRSFGRVVEEAGVESVWAVEHVVVAADYAPEYPYSSDGRMPGRSPMPDPLELLSFVAGATERLRLGTCVVVAPLHSPVVLAKRAATLDLVSGERLELGLGIGWQREEYAAAGAPFDRRGARLEEGMAAMRALWSGGEVSFAGEFAAFDRVDLTIRPRRQIPLVLGGNSTAAITRAGRIADGWFPYTMTPDDFAAAAALLRETAQAAGRDPADVRITAWPGSCDPARELEADWVARYVEAGATRLILRPKITAPDQLDDLRRQIDEYRRLVLDVLA